MLQRLIRPIPGLLLVGVMVTALGCSHNKPTVPEPAVGTLAVAIVAGPDAANAVPPGSKITFKWQATGGGGTYSYTYKIDSGSEKGITAGQTSVVLFDPDLLTSGSHTFTIKVGDGTNTATAARTFVIGTTPLSVSVTFPPEGYKLAPGKSVRFEWAISDPSKAYKIGWAVDDTTGIATWALSEALPTAGFADNLPVGWHYIFVRIQDLGGVVTVVKDSVEVIEPTILYVNEAVLEPGYAGNTPHLSDPDKFRRSRYLWGSVFDGFAVQEWNVAEQGYPTTAGIPATVKTIVWVGSGDYQSSSWGWNVGWEYTYSVATGHGPAPNVLTYFIDSGGKVWITGENWLEEINVGVDNPFPDGLENTYLGMDTLSASFGPDTTVIFDFAAVEPGWPSLSTDIAKLESGLGDGAVWSCDFTQYLRPNVTPLYRVSGYAVGGVSTPPPDNNWYAAWAVKDASGNPQVVFMGFDIYYFSADAGREVGHKILRDLFGN